jgi:hypothetical protein
LLKPLRYPHPEELVALRFTALGVGFKDLPISDSSYFVFREQSQTFQDVGLYDRGIKVKATRSTSPVLGSLSTCRLSP